MSKIETLRHLPTPAQVRENVQQLGQMLAETSEKLDSTARQVQSLEQLPSLVADQVSESLKALAPILSMQQEVQTALEAFDRVNQAQRQSLEEMAQELSSQAARSMEQKTASLTATLESVTENTRELLRGLKVSMDLMGGAVTKIQNLPAQLTTDLSCSVTDLKAQAERLESAGSTLKTETDRARTRPRWKVWAELMTVAVLCALLVLAGQAGLNKILPGSELQAQAQKQAQQAQQAQWGVNLWAKASDAEKKLLNQIVSRPAR